MLVSLFPPFCLVYLKLYSRVVVIVVEVKKKKKQFFSKTHTNIQ